MAKATANARGVVETAVANQTTQTTQMVNEIVRGRPEFIIDQNPTVGSKLNNQQTASDAFLGSTAPMDTGRSTRSPHQNNTAGDAFMGSRAPLNTGRPGRANNKHWYGWGIDGHDLASIYADQTDNYFAVMSSTARPAAGLDMRD